MAVSQVLATSIREKLRGHAMATVEVPDSAASGLARATAG